MIVLGSLIDIEVVKQATAERTFGQHAFHSVTEHLLYTVGLLTELGRSVEALTAGITSVAGVNLVGLFLAGELHLGGVDDDHIVTTVNMRSEGGLVLATNDLCHS